jgi:hypothetical protein
MEYAGPRIFENADGQRMVMRAPLLCDFLSDKLDQLDLQSR